VIDRRNRWFLAVIGLVLLVGGGLSGALGGGAFGNARAQRDVFDRTLIRWWNEGGWESFAVVTAIGAAVAMIGAASVWRQLHRDGGQSRTPAVTFLDDGSRGETTLRPSALERTLAVDLERLSDVEKASVGLFGTYPGVEMRTVLTLGDDADLDRLPAQVDEVLARAETTAGIRPDPILVTLRFKAAEPQRSLD
jgi:hypothetical protein